MRLLVKRMKETGASLIWRSTTPVPKGAGGRVPGDSAKYNAIAAKIMKEEGIPTNDLYAVSMKFKEGMQKPANVHYSPEGSNALADAAVESILAALKRQKKE